MSKFAVTGNNLGTGVFTIAAPNSNTDRTFNLPDETGQLLTDVSDIEPQVKTSLNATGDAPMFACRAFVNFDGTGTVSIRDSGNVSSITDNGAGRYTINFTTAMPDANYSVSTAVSQVSPFPIIQAYLGGFSSTSAGIAVAEPGRNFFDTGKITISVFR